MRSTLPLALRRCHFGTGLSLVLAGARTFPIKPNFKIEARSKEDQVRHADLDGPINLIQINAPPVKIANGDMNIAEP